MIVRGLRPLLAATLLLTPRESSGTGGSTSKACTHLESADPSVRDSVLKTIEEAQMEACQDAAFELARNPRVEDGQRERAFIAALAAGQNRGERTAQLGVNALSRGSLSQELGVRFSQALLRFVARLPAPLAAADGDQAEAEALARRVLSGESVTAVPWFKDAAPTTRKALAGGRLSVHVSGSVARIQATFPAGVTTVLALKSGRRWVLAGPVKRDLR
jgi:hypothetical protein